MLFCVYIELRDDEEKIGDDGDAYKQTILWNTTKDDYVFIFFIFGTKQMSGDGNNSN